MRRAWQNGDVRVQITTIQQLQDVLANMAKKITVNLPIEIEFNIVAIVDPGLPIKAHKKVISRREW